MNKLIFSLVLVLFPMISYGGVWSGVVTIKNIRVTNDGGFRVYTNEVVNAACVNSGKYFRVAVGVHGVNIEGQKALLSTALTVMSTNTPIIVFIDTATADCFTQAIQTYNQ